MLQDIRDKTQGWITRVIVGLVCAAFILWGAHSFLASTGPSGNDIARVNGQDISPAQFNAAYQRLAQQQQAQLGAQLTDKMQANLKQEALQQLVVSTALQQAAQKRDLRFAPQQVGRVIAGISAFQQDGHFSPKKFSQTLSSLGFSEDEFFDSIRDAMLINQLRVGIIGSSFALPTEVDQALQLVNQKRDIAYVIIPSKNFATQAATTDAQLKDYYQAHQDQFTVPQTVTVQYLELALPDLATKMKLAVNDPKVLQAFSDATDKLNNLTYTNPQALDVAAKALDLSIQTGGPMTMSGDDAKGVLANDAVKSAVFSKDVLSGNNSNVINLDDQHALVVRVLKQQPSMVKPFDQVKAQIADAFKAKKTQELATNAAQDMVTQVMAGKSLDDLAKVQKLTVVKQAGVSRYTAGGNAAVNNAAFQLGRPGKQPSVSMFPLPSSDIAVIQVMNVSANTDAKMASVQQRVMNQQIANGYAQLEYQLYVNGVLADAKVNINQVLNKQAS